jgi:hypothetical protein
MRRQLIGSIRAGEATTRIAERLLAIDKPIVHLPKHVRALRDAAQMATQLGQPNHYRAAVNTWRGRVERLGQGVKRAPGAYTMRSATQQLVKDLNGASVQQADAAVERWVLERARHQARMIARTETVDAFREVYRKGAESQPYTRGFRWKTTIAHGAPDECDIIANQDDYGLGPGGYPAGSLPTNPHPHCTCSVVAIVDAQHFKRELAKLKGTAQPAQPWISGKRETGQSWVKRQPAAYQRKLLGPTRYAALQAGQQVIAADGTRCTASSALQHQPARSERPCRRRT